MSSFPAHGQSRLCSGRNPRGNNRRKEKEAIGKKRHKTRTDRQRRRDIKNKSNNNASERQKTDRRIWKANHLIRIDGKTGRMRKRCVENRRRRNKHKWLS
jgi:hypothetical protein